MYIKWLTWIICLVIVYVIQTNWDKKILQLSQRNDKFPLPQKKQGNYPVINIYDWDLEDWEYVRIFYILYATNYTVIHKYQATVSF